MVSNYSPSNSSGQAEFNMSFGFLNRLNVEFYTLAQSKEQRNYKDWVEHLLIIFCELSNYINKKHGKDYEYMYNTARKLKETLSAREFEGSQNEISAEFYWNMIDFELELRNIMKYNNIELKMSDDPRLVL